MTKASSAPAFNPYEIYDTNEDYEVDGIWFVDPTQRYKLARAGGRNKSFGNIHEAITKPFKRAIQTKTLPKDMDLELSHELYAKAVVKNWSVASMVQDPKGKWVAEKDANGKTIWIDGKMFDPETFAVIDATVENIIRAYKIKPELYSYHVQMSNEVQNFKDEDAEAADVKNS